MRIGLDLDGVLYEWEPTARYLIDKYHGIHLSESQDFDDIKAEVPPEVWNWLWTEGVLYHGLFRHGSLYRGGKDAADMLKKHGDLIIISNRPGHATQDTMDWLDFHRIPYNEVHILGAGAKKSKITPHCDVYIDDSPKVVFDLIANTGAEVLLWDRPWNSGVRYDKSTRLLRVRNWGTVERRLREIAG